MGQACVQRQATLRAHKASLCGSTSTVLRRNPEADQDIALRPYRSTP
jgi:hypothetical protein